MDDVDGVIDWKPVERFSNIKLRRNKHAADNPAYVGDTLVPSARRPR